MAPGNHPPPPPPGQWPPPGPPAAPWPPVGPPFGQPVGPSTVLPPPQWPEPGAPSEPEPAPRTSPLAVAAFLCALLGWWLFGLGSLAGIVLGIVSLRQIGQANGGRKGRGLASAGIVLGAGFVLLFLLSLTVFHR